MSRATALALIVTAAFAATAGAAPPPKQPTLSIGDTAVAEGDGGTATAVFTVTLSAASNKAVTVDFATADDTATRTSDYEAASGTLVFQRGQTSRGIAVSLHGDAVDEPDETFFLRLSGAGQATIADGTGRATIFDDDPSPSETHALSVSRDGDGAGTVTSTPAGVDCGEDCSESYADGTSVTLVATPADGSTFVGWAGDCGGPGPCTVEMDAARHVVAVFSSPSAPPGILAVSLRRDSSDTGSRVESVPAGIDCGQTCTATFLAGTVVQLRAVPGPQTGLFPFCFKDWSGDATGSAEQAAVTMDGNRSVTATFGVSVFGACS